jgi:hypothetical protein
MWTFERHELPDGCGLRFELARAGNPASYVEVLHGWRRSEAFRAFFGTMLAGVPFTALRWETPAVSSTTAGERFECVVLDSPKLDRRPDPSAFAEHFEADGPEVVRFANIGGDAVMVVPRPVGNATAYGHLAAFLRRAPPEQRDALWQSVGEAMLERLSAKPVWLSTAGAGVAWLHVRLDDRPKYYGHGPYRHGVARVAEVIHRRSPTRRPWRKKR